MMSNKTIKYNHTNQLVITGTCCKCTDMCWRKLNKDHVSGRVRWKGGQQITDMLVTYSSIVLSELDLSTSENMTKIFLIAYSIFFQFFSG